MAMKKIFMILAMAAMTAGAYAQDDMTSEDGMSELSGKKYTVVTNGFWTNWFVEASASMPKFDKVGMSMSIGSGSRLPLVCERSLMPLGQKL